MWQIGILDAAHVRSLAECHIACWREAYRGIVPDHVLAAFDVERRADVWRRVLEAEENAVHVALAGDRVIGFASAGPARDVHPITPLELYAIYVRSASYGSGVADALLDAAVGGTAPCSLWVFERNPRALAFYRRHGFTLDGTSRLERFGADTNEIRMVRGQAAAGV